MRRRPLSCAWPAHTGGRTSCSEPGRPVLDAGAAHLRAARRAARRVRRPPAGTTLSGFMQRRYSASATPDKALSFESVYSMTLWGDMRDLCFAGFCANSTHANTGDEHGDRCIGFVRVLEDGSDVYISQVRSRLWDAGFSATAVEPHRADQVAWSDLNSMLRTYKSFNFSFSGAGTTVPGARSSFSSYPGVAQWRRLLGGAVSVACGRVQAF